MTPSTKTVGQIVSQNDEHYENFKLRGFQPILVVLLGKRPCKMRFPLLTFLCCALVTASPSREDSREEWGGKHPHGGAANVIKKVDGGAGGGVGVIGIGGRSCDPVACDIKAGYIYGYPKRLYQY